MCIAVPGEIAEILPDGGAVADFMGVRKRISLSLLDGCSVGDFVIVHAGFAISVLRDEDARETLYSLRRLCGYPE